MLIQITKYCLLFLFFLNILVLAEDIGSSNDADSEIRQPRVSGRIVKLYSGTRPEPIYCPHEGFQPDPANCAVFYRCVKGANNKFTVFRFQCGPGTVYDPDTEVCNFPQSTRRSECGGFALPSLDKTNENEIVETRPEFPSPINMRPVYSEAIKEITTQSAYPWAPTKKENTQYSSTAYPWMTPESNQGSSMIGTTLQPPPRNQNGDACTKDGFMGDSENCRKFYRCVNNQRGGFIRYEFSCSETTVWDNDAQSCNHPWAVERSRCGRSNSDNIIKPSNTNEQSLSNKSSSPGTTIQEQLQVNYGQKVSQSQTQINYGQVIQNQTQISYSDRNDNKQNSQAKQNQTQISHGSAISQTQTQINYGNGVQSQLQIDHTKDSSQSQSQTYEMTSKKSTTSGTTQDEQEQTYGMQPSTQGNNDDMNDNNECTESGFRGDKNDCKMFYRCVDNGKGGFIKYEFQCGEGTVWDSSIEGCNHAWAVKTCGSSSTDINKIETTTAQSTPITVSLVQTTTQTSTENVDYDSGYGQQPSESSPTSSTTRNPIQNTQSTEQPTTGRPTTGVECSQDGFMGDKNDCKKFFRCVGNGRGGFTKYEFRCGEGTVWDSEITACNHPKSGKPCDSGSSSQSDNIAESSQDSTTTQSSPTSVTQITDEPSSTSKPSSTSESPSSQDCFQEGFIGDVNDCKKFYRCVDNGKGGFTKYEFSCGEGTVWDAEINTCNHPSSSKQCGNSSAQISEQPASTEPNRENDEMYGSTNALISSTEQSQTMSSSDKPIGSNDKCTSEGFYGDSNDCRKFYRCVDNGKGGFTKHEFKCGDGTVWDQEIQACNHESSDSKCSRDSQSSQPQTESNKGSTSTSQSTTQEQQSTQKPQRPLNETNTNCTSEGFYANPEDCRKFYRCVDNGKGGYTKYDFSCGEGTVWVQEIQACDHDTGESCSSQSESSSFTTETTNEQQSSTSYVSSSSSSTQQPEKQEDENSNVSTSGPTSSGSSDSTKTCTAEGFYPNNNDCRKFYRCVDNGNGGYTKYNFTCGEGTAWDSDIQSCNHISEVKSCQVQEQETGQPIQDEQVSESPGETQTSTSENSKPTSKDTCEKEGYYGNSQDCTKFYRCVDNGNGGFTKYDFDCGEGTIWDQDVTTCNHPRDVSNPSCQQSDNSDSSTFSSSTTTSSSSSSSSESSSSTTESSSSDCSGSSTKKPDKNNINCTKAGYYPDPDDCKKFYRCVDWDGDGKRFSVYHFDCGEGTIWDPALDTCNHEDSVYPPRDCSGSQSQGENVNQETTESTSTTTHTNDQTTTQETITSEQTNTSEQTTTQQSTTSQQTTTQQSTTSQQTTTQQPTNSEQTTTQQSTTSDQTTTQQSTTSEQTTTQQSTTSEQTTQQSTTSEQTTTQQTTTEESTEKQTTTQQTTTSEQTTTQESTTKHTTIAESEQQSTIQETTTTESSTTEGTTTDGTTEQSTTSQTDASETTESTTSTSASSNDEPTTTESTTDKECPETDEDQNLFVCPTSFKRHPKYCNMFYQCTEDDDTHDVQIATFHCPNNTIYDETKTQCVEEKKADKKCNGEMARKRRLKRYDVVYKEPIVVTNERLKCPAAGHYPFEKGDCSPAFLKCKMTKSGKIRGFIYQCPQDYVYWSVSRRCEQKSHVRDCKKSGNDWKGRWEIPVERRNVAP